MPQIVYRVEAAKLGCSPKKVGTKSRKKIRNCV